LAAKTAENILVESEALPTRENTEHVLTLLKKYQMQHASRKNEKRTFGMCSLSLECDRMCNE
jgi:hypothetical protein